MMHRVSVENVASLLAVASKYKTEVSYILYIYTQTDCTAEVEHNYYDSVIYVLVLLHMHAVSTSVTHLAVC